MKAARRKEATSLPIQETAQNLEKNLQLELALSIVDLRASTGVLRECSITCILIGSVESCAIEGIEVVNLQDCLPPFANVEVFPGVQIFHEISRIPEISVNPVRVADDVLRRGCGKACRVEHRWSGSRAAMREVITYLAVRGG